MQPLAGYRIGVTASRKAEEQVQLLERRGAVVVWAPALSTDAGRVDDASLRLVTEQVLARPVDLFLATTGIGVRTWFGAADEWGLDERLAGHLADSEILARGPKTVGALRRRGLREHWVAPSERLEEMVAHLEGRDVAGRHVVVQEHGQSLSPMLEGLRGRGAEVTTVAVYRIAPPDDPAPLRGLVDDIVARAVDAVTFTSPPAVLALMRLAESAGRVDDVVSAFTGPVLASCVGPVTAEAFEVWQVPTVHPDRSRLAAMVKQLDTELPARRGVR